MTAALLWTLGSLIFAAEIAAIVVLIARDGETAKSRDAADWARIKGMFAEEREDLAEPVLAGGDVEVIHIGRPPMPVRQTPTDLAAAYEPTIERTAESLEPAGSPWRVPLGSAVAISQAAASQPVMAVGSYRPRHAKDGETTQTFKAIVAQLVDEPTTEIAVRAA